MVGLLIRLGNQSDVRSVGIGENGTGVFLIAYCVARWFWICGNIYIVLTSTQVADNVIPNQVHVIG